MKVGDFVSWGTPWKESGEGVVISIRTFTRLDGSIRLRWAVCEVFHRGRTEEFLSGELKVIQ